MKRLTVFVITFISFIPSVFGQLSDGSVTGVPTGQGLNVQKNSIMWSKPAFVSEVVGQFFIDSLWHVGNITFSKAISQAGGSASDTLIGIPIRYNVFTNELEVLADKKKNDIRAVPGNNLKGFTLKTSENEILHFSNTRLFASDKELTGFFKTLVTGKLTLMKYYYARKQKPNYNPSFNVGDKNTNVSVESDYYVVSKAKQKK